MRIIMFQLSGFYYIPFNPIEYNPNTTTCIRIQYKTLPYRSGYTMYVTISTLTNNIINSPGNSGSNRLRHSKELHHSRVANHEGSCRLLQDVSPSHSNDH